MDKQTRVHVRLPLLPHFPELLPFFQYKAIIGARLMVLAHGRFEAAVMLLRRCDGYSPTQFASSLSSPH